MFLSLPKREGEKETEKQRKREEPMSPLIPHYVFIIMSPFLPDREGETEKEKTRRRNREERENIKREGSEIRTFRRWKPRTKEHNKSNDRERERDFGLLY